MKTFLALLFSITILWVVGCHTPTPQKAVANNLKAIHLKVEKQVNDYYDLVLARAVPTNGVPAVRQSYDNFQTVFNAAVVTMISDTNAVMPSAVTVAADQVTTTIQKAKAP